MVSGDRVGVLEASNHEPKVGICGESSREARAGVWAHQIVTLGLDSRQCQRVTVTSDWQHITSVYTSDFSLITFHTRIKGHSKLAD